MFATNLKRTGSFRTPKATGPVTREPTNLNDLRRVLDPAAGMPTPIRPQGAGNTCIKRQRHTCRKAGPQNHRSKGTSYDSGVASTNPALPIRRPTIRSCVFGA